MKSSGVNAVLPGSMRTTLLPRGIQFEQPRTIVRCEWRKHACFGPKDQRLTRAAHERCRVAVMHEPERVSKFVCDDVARGAGRAQRSHAIGLDNDEEALGKGSRHREDV